MAEPVSAHYESDEPATALFSDFGQLSHDLTEAMNESMFDLSGSRAVIVPLDEFLKRNNEELDDLRALQRRFSGMFNVDRGIWTPAIPTVGRYFGWGLQSLARSGRMLDERQDAFERRAAMFHDFDRHLREVYNQTDYRRVDELQTADEDMKHREVCRLLNRLDGQISTYDRLFWYWIESALTLLRSPIAGEISPAARQKSRDISSMWVAAERFYQVVPHYRRLINEIDTIEALLDEYRDSGVAAVRRKYEKSTQRLAQELQHARDLLDSVIHPFERKSRYPVSWYVFEKGPREEQNPVAAAIAFGERFPKLYARVVGRLSACAESVQTAVEARGDMAASASDQEAGRE